MFAEIDGNSTHYVSEGEGPPVLFVHGNASSSRFFEDTLAALPPRYRGLAPDLELELDAWCPQCETSRPCRQAWSSGVTRLRWASGLTYGVLAVILVVPVVKISYVLRQFDLQHIAVMVHEDSYDDVVAEVGRVLARHGLETEVNEPHWAIRWVFAGLVWMEGKIFRREYMSRDMKIVRGELPDGGWFEVTLHATDISVVGQKPETTCVMAVLAEELDEQYLYFSWDDESQALEDRIRDHQLRLEQGEQVPIEEIRALSEELGGLALSEEEWNAIRRQIYRLERDHYRLQVEGEVDELVR
jgi:hypothetical protein